MHFIIALNCESLLFPIVAETPILETFISTIDLISKGNDENLFFIKSKKRRDPNSNLLNRI
jgi:hypothetical protein